MVGFTVAAALLAVFTRIERRAAQPLIPPHTRQVGLLAAGTAVMLGVTGVLVGAVFLTSIYLQGVLGYSALRAGLAFLPFALAITLGTQVARHALQHASPRGVAVVGLIVTAGAAMLLSTAATDASYVADLLPGLLLLGVGVGMVFVPVSISAMAGIPPQHSGLASGFLMTGHEVGAALGVAVLSAVATTAGSLTTSAAIVTGYSRGFVAAAAVAGAVAVVAALRMPATRIDAAGAGMHGHGH